MNSNNASTQGNPTAQNNQVNAHLGEEALIEQYRTFQSNVSQIENKKQILQFQLQDKSTKLQEAQNYAQDKFGTSDVEELRGIYRENLAHNQSVIPQALEESSLQLQRINDVFKSLGIQQ